MLTALNHRSFGNAANLPTTKSKTKTLLHHHSKMQLGVKAEPQQISCLAFEARLAVATRHSRDAVQQAPESKAKRNNTHTHSAENKTSYHPGPRMQRPKRRISMRGFDEFS